MDWIRLGNSGKDLTSVGGVLKDVTEKELAEHIHQENAWISIRGTSTIIVSWCQMLVSFAPLIIKKINFSSREGL